MEQKGVNYLEKSFINVRKFAEILYKCKLCTSLPSILTSEDSFLAHVNNTHLQNSEALKKCQICPLKFRTKEDLWAHKKLTHSDFASDDEESCEENETAWQVPKDNGETISANSSKRKRSKKEMCRRKKIKEEEIEQDPHVVITHGVECNISPSPQNAAADLQKLTNQIESDAIPSGIKGSNLSYLSSTPEFGKYTKLIREGGNIVYFCQVCNWKTQMKIMFTEHCKSTAHLVKVTVAEQNESHEKNSYENSTHGKRGHFMSFLDEKINFYINKRLSNESLTADGDVKLATTNISKEHVEQTNNQLGSEGVIDIAIKKEPVNIEENMMEISQSMATNNDQVQGSRRKRKITNRLIPTLDEETDDWSDNSDSMSKQSLSKISCQGVEIPKSSSKNWSVQFKRQKESSDFSPYNSKTEQNESQKKMLHEQSNLENSKTNDTSANLPANLCDIISKTVESELHPASYYMYRCSLCSYVCNDIIEYRGHFESEHEPEQADTVTDVGYTDCKTEQKKIQRIKDLLPDIIMAHPRGNVSRDLLLQKASGLVNEPEIALWGPACNKALRDMFPDSLAQRKGKYKKTYFFGVALIEQIQEQETTNSNDGNDMDYSPLRDMTQDMDKILQYLHTIVNWKGDLEAGVSRDDVLHILGRKIDDPEVLHWGVQCNRAIRILFPNVQMKRKGKYKTTVYFGVTFSDQVTKDDFASLTKTKTKIQKPVLKDDGIRPKLTWRDAIRTISNKAFTNSDKRAIITRGWGPLMNPAGTQVAKHEILLSDSFMHDTLTSEGAQPNITSDVLSHDHCSPIQQVSSPQSMSLLRYHLTSDELNVYHKGGLDLAKSVWQSKEQLIKARENAGKSAPEVALFEEEIQETASIGDEKSNDADDENSQSTIGEDQSSFYPKNSGNPTVVETEDGVMYIKKEICSEEEC